MPIIRPDIAALNAYHVPPAKGLLKLDAMENPYTLPEPVLQELAQTLVQAEINRYPDPAAPELTQALREAFHIPDHLSVLWGNGSDEIIQMLAMLVAQPGATMMAFEPSFVMYQMTAKFCGLNYIGVPLNEDFSLDIEKTLDTIINNQPALIFIAYPNNPTGNAFSRKEIEVIIAASTGLVVIDEAYFAFAEDSFLHDIDLYPNVLVMRTLSKLGLAGARLGFIVGAPKWANELNKVRMPYNINVLSQLYGTFALKHLNTLTAQTKNIVQERERYYPALAEFSEIEVFRTQANFVLIRVPDADALFARFIENNILIKNLSKAHPLLKNCLRITVGSEADNQQVLATLQGYFT
jgi:histidinol-phosphate aminotransferase